MANIVSKKNNRGAVKAWEIRSKLLTVNGSKFMFYASANVFDKPDVEGIRDLLAACEKDVAITGAIQPHTIQRINPFPFLLDALAEKGLIDAAPYTTLGDVYDKALADLERTAKPQTAHTARNSLRYMLEYFKKNTPITDITQREAQAFNGYLNDKVTAGKLAQTTKNKAIARSKWLFKWYSGQAPKPIVNPFQNIKSGSTYSEREPRIITDDEATRILDAIAKHRPPRAYYDPLEWKAWFLLGYRQGLRILSEAPELKWEFIDFDGKTLMIKDVKRSERSKGAKWRKMPLFPETAAALWKLKQERERNGETLVNVFSDWWKLDVKSSGANAFYRFVKICEEAGVETDRPRQVLRQTASNRIREERDEYLENIWLGHTKDVARSAYYSNEIPQNVLDDIPSWKEVATD